MTRSSTRSLRELRADLTVMARSPVPPPRPSFVAALEARLTSIEPGTVVSDCEPDLVALHKAPRGRGGLTVAVALAVVLSTVGVATVSSSSGDGHGGDTATVAAAGPGGRRLPAATDRDASASSASAASMSVRPDGDTAVDRVHPHGAAARTVPGTAAGPARPLRDPTDGAADDATPGVLADPRPSTSLALRGSGTPAYTFLDWDRYEGADFAAYLVLRAAAPDDPTWPDESGHTLMMQRIDDRDTTAYDAQGKVATTPRYRIVVVDAAGDVVASTGVYQADVTAASIGAPRSVPQPPS
jgi:hypothetical protein